MQTIAAALLTLVMAKAAFATTGPCLMDDYTCEPVMDASGCYNAIILGWEGASKNPADIFKCVDPPELVSISIYLPLSLLFFILHQVYLGESFDWHLLCVMG
jgi:hypothetical protein